MNFKVTPLSLKKKIICELGCQLGKINVKEHVLREIFWECTLRCNLNCRHCGSDCRKTSDFKDMPMEDFLRVLDNVASHTNPNRVFISVTGGEPLMRQDLEICGEEIYKRGFAWGMVTNGLLMTRERLEGLIKAGLHSVTVSLDGLEEEHNWMRGNPNSFEKAVSAIKLLCNTPMLGFDVVTCVNKRNLPRLEELKRFLISIGLKRWRIATITPMGRAATDDDLQLSSEEFREVMEFIRRSRKESEIAVKYACEGFLGNYETEVRSTLYSCNAGVRTASVLIDGSISACASIRSNYHQGNIYEDDFMEVWNNRFQPYRNREWMRKGVCADCDYFRYCRGNGMHLRDENGDLYFCHLKKLKNK